MSERAASQEHFIDLCRLLGQPTPAEHDATGAEYTFEKGVVPAGGASRSATGAFGFAEVWWRGKFGWEYKRNGKYRDLTEAYRQLCQYREALDNPPGGSRPLFGIRAIRDIFVIGQVKLAPDATAYLQDMANMLRQDRPVAKPIVSWPNQGCP